MKFLLVSIGDLHIDAVNTISKNKVDSLIDLLLSRLDSIDNIIFVINGDIVNLGKEEEFEVALEMFCDIESKLLEVNDDIDISYVIAPGNHDCDIIGQDENTLKKLSRLKRDIDKNGNFEEYKKILKKTNKQDSFFLFCDALKNPFLNNQNSFRDIFRTIDYNYKKGKIRFVILNSSLFFNKGTKQGDVFIDFERVKSNVFSEDNTILILVSHYPTEWFNRKDGQQIQDFVDYFDVLIYGHEHYGDIIEKKSNKKENIEIRNPMFNSSYQEKETGLVLINLDSFSMKLDAEIFIYNGTMFQPKDNKKRDLLLSNSTYSNAHCVLLKEPFDDMYKIDEIIIGDDTINIGDLYIDIPLRCVNLEEIDTESDEKHDDFEYISSDNIDYTRFSCIGLYGKMESGKTTLLNHYYLEFFNQNYIPILVHGSVLNRHIDESVILNIINDQYSKQYGTSSEILRQKPKKLVIIIDDFHFIQNYDYKRLMLEILTKNYFLVIFTSSISYKSTDLNTFNFNKFIQYEILELGQKELYKLIEKWMIVTNKNTEISNHNRLVSLKDKINTILMKKYLPLSPFFVLMILKANDDNSFTDLQSSHKRVYYEYLINKLIIDIIEDVKFNQNDIHLHFKEMAYYTFTYKSPNFKDFIKYMQSKYSFDDDYNFVMREFKNILIKKKIFNFDNGLFKFNYKFMYYTFLAQFITENIDENPIDFRLLFDNILDEENANVLLFLSQYFAKSLIIDQVINYSDNLLKDFKEIEFTKEDLEIYNHFILGVKNIEKFGTVKDNHSKLMSLVDEEQRKNSVGNVNEQELFERLSNTQKQMISSSKMMQIINELLYSRLTSKNTSKLLLAGINLGRRVLSYYTFEYIRSIIDYLSDKKHKQLLIEEDEEMDYIKKMTIMFLNILMFSVDNLGSINNLPSIKKVEINDNCFSLILDFIFRLKSEDENIKLDMIKIKKMISSFESNNNHLLKGLVFSVLNYELNYVGLTPRKITEISNYLGISEKKRKQLLSKAF